jgi:type III pantothenate kinase
MVPFGFGAAKIRFFLFSQKNSLKKLKFLLNAVFVCLLSAFKCIFVACSKNLLLKLIIDIGNTRTKLAVFTDNKTEEIFVTENLSAKLLIEITEKYPAVGSVILSAVKDYPPEIDDFLRDRFYFLKLDSQTPLPVKILYKSPQTLGKDRMAIAAASHTLFPGKNVLAIDAGTTITYDFVNEKGEFLGGGISPGIRMRLKALHVFTGKLPRIDTLDPAPELIGNNTQSSILSGVLNGIVAEVNGIILSYHARYSHLKVVLSGGDEKYFDKRLKNNIFALPNFVLKGLKDILDFNEEKKKE